MSNTGSSIQEISEEDDQGNTHEINSQSINEEENQGNTQNINEEKKRKVMKVTANEQNADKIFNLFRPVSKISLTGKAGTGKTWIASQIYKRVLKKTPVEPIWICLDRMHNEQSLFDTIARQFSLPTSADEREDNGEDEKREGSKKERRESIEQRLKDKMKERLAGANAEEFLLMVLDGQFDMLTVSVDDKTGEVEIENYIKKLLGLEGGHSANYEEKFKVLITRRRSEDGDDSKELKVEVEPLSGTEALKLFKNNVSNRNLLSHGLFKDLSDAIEKKDKVSPAEILILAGTLSYFAKDTSGDLDLKLELAIKTATNDLNKLLRYTYDKEPGNCLIDCFWHSWQFLHKHGGIHFNELITNWIMEGYIKPTDQIDKAYENGHHILMQLLGCHMLKMQEDNVIVVEGAIVEKGILDMNEYCRRGYSGTADPGLASVLKDCERTVLEGITPADGMMKTLCNDMKEEMISSLLIDGSRLCRENHETFFEAKRKLNLLAILYPRLKSPDEVSISKMKELRVLMLRGAYLLKGVDQIASLEHLTVLEISGSTSVQEIPIFDKVSKLRSLKLSALGIQSLPESFSELIELRRLILSKCSSLIQLPKLVKLTKLEVIDLSECTNLEKIQEKSFKVLENLQVINFSQTKIEKLPIIKSLQKLKIVLLKGCSELAGMRTVKQVSSLKILDLSGAVNIKEIMYDSFEGADKIEELDLSGTQIQFLPSDIHKLQKLRLEGCKLLKNLPELEGHSTLDSTLEELDLSGCTSLPNLPELGALKSLKILSVKDCKQLERLLGLESLSKLEKLDLRGTDLWRKDEVKSLMSHNNNNRLKILVDENHAS